LESSGEDERDGGRVKRESDIFKNGIGGKLTILQLRALRRGNYIQLRKLRVAPTLGIC
jgi:hypothetical protein